MVEEFAFADLHEPQRPRPRHLDVDALVAAEQLRGSGDDLLQLLRRRRPLPQSVHDPRQQRQPLLLVVPAQQSAVVSPRADQEAVLVDLQTLPDANLQFHTNCLYNLYHTASSCLTSSAGSDSGNGSSPSAVPPAPLPARSAADSPFSSAGCPPASPGPSTAAAFAGVVGLGRV